MPIKLEVKEYCHDCSNFEASVDKLYADNKVIRTIITCENQIRCEYMLNFLKKKSQEFTKSEIRICHNAQSGPCSFRVYNDNIGLCDCLLEDNIVCDYDNNALND